MELQGWKEIAHYLGVTERTAQKWARFQNMPVSHLPGKKGRVFTTAVTLDAWKLTGPLPAPAEVRKAITCRLTERDLANVRVLVPSRFASVQEFVSRAVAHYAEQQLGATASAL